MNDPQISVITGTYNPEKKELESAVESVVRQSFEDWELIIYDDGSDRLHAGYINSICSSDTRIRLIRSESNDGLAHGLNECISVSRGKYIARMDDDDISEPDRLLKQKAFLDSNMQYGWVGSTAVIFDEKGVWGRANRPERPEAEDFLGSSPFIHPSVMFRKEVLNAVDGYMEHAVTSRCEDYELFMTLYANGMKGYNIQTPLIRYRQDRDKLRRSWRYCLNEAIVRYSGFKKMKILNPRTCLYVAKPVFVRLAAYTPLLAQRLRTRGKKGDTRDK